MMDLKEIIKWFIPCFHILLVILKDKRLTFICLFLLFNIRIGCAVNVDSVDLVQTVTKNLDRYINDSKLNLNQSDVVGAKAEMIEIPRFADGSVGRTFGRPFKKMMTALLPLVFQIGAASTWAVVAALVGIKTLAVTLLILKILLIAGAAKAVAAVENAVKNGRRQTDQALKPWYLDFKPDNTFTTSNEKKLDENVEAQKVGALFGSKSHGHFPQQPAWEPHPPQKEIHLHIHNGHQEVTHEEHGGYGPWSREDAPNLDSKPIVVNPSPNTYPYVVGPQTIRTPFGNYVRVEDANDPSSLQTGRR